MKNSGPKILPRGTSFRAWRASRDSQSNKITSFLSNKYKWHQLNHNIYVNTILMFTLTLRCINGDRFLTVYAEFPIFALYKINREYFMESAGVRYLRTSCWRIRNRTNERSERVRFLIQKQRVRKYRTKHFPCGIVFILYILRHRHFGGLFILNLSGKNAKICLYTLTAKLQRKRSISFLVKTFVKNINDCEDMR